MSRHDETSQPSTGDGRRRSRPKIQPAENTVRTSGGAVIWKATAKLFGLGMGKKSK